MADRPDQHRLGGTPAHRQPSLEQHVRPGLPFGLALVWAVVGLQQLLLQLHGSSGENMTTAATPDRNLETNQWVESRFGS
jgi:hypothetical protein